MNWAHETAARTLYQECRGEPREGQVAVAWVLRNRLTAGHWGTSLASVCLWRNQFSGWISSDPNFVPTCALPDGDKTLAALSDILDEVMTADPATDPTHGADHYHATSIHPPAWAASMTPCGTIGRHIFYKAPK
jgi:N-acetylmuramoyl-L-alanine amidase